jgi:hypothetical protein
MDLAVQLLRNTKHGCDMLAGTANMEESTMLSMSRQIRLPAFLALLTFTIGTVGCSSWRPMPTKEQEPFRVDLREVQEIRVREPDWGMIIIGTTVTVALVVSVWWFLRSFPDS